MTGVQTCALPILCDFVDDLGSEKRERWVCVLVLGLFLFVILVVRG